MKKTICAMVLLGSLSTANAQTPSTPSRADQVSYDLGLLIEFTATAHKKKFIVDPRVRASVFIAGSKPPILTYAELLDVLAIHGYAAVESDDHVNVIVIADARSSSMPVVTGNKAFMSGEWVTRIIPIKSVPAATLVPILRPMVPQFAHLAASPCTNSLVLVDRFANIKRILAVIESLDQGPAYKAQTCVMDETKRD